ncbi:unnamed protein product, partial [Microthlaspi erraticum]
MGIKPIISRTKDGKKIRGDRIHAGNLMPLIDQLLSYKTTAYSTRFKREGSLVLEESSRLSSVQLESIWTREGLLQQDGWILSFARPTSSLNTRSWMGGSNSNSLILWLAPPSFFCPTLSSPTVLGGTNIDFSPPLYTLVGHEEDLREEEPELDRAEDRVEERHVNADLGEPECYYFEEYEAPRMNPSVVAAHKRIGLLQRFNKWQGKAMEKMQKSMDKMVSKIKSLEKKVSGSSSKKKKSKAPTFPRRRRRRQHAEKEEEFQGQTLDSTTGLDRVQTEETQLDRAEGRVDLEEPLFENPGIRVRFNPVPGLLSDSLDSLQPLRASAAPPRPRKPHTLSTMKKRRKRSHKLDRVRQLHGRLPSPDHDLPPSSLGGTE